MSAPGQHGDASLADIAGAEGAREAALRRVAAKAREGEQWVREGTRKVEELLAGGSIRENAVRDEVDAIMADAEGTERALTALVAGFETTWSRLARMAFDEARLKRVRVFRIRFEDLQRRIPSAVGLREPAKWNLTWLGQQRGAEFQRVEEELRAALTAFSQTSPLNDHVTSLRRLETWLENRPVAVEQLEPFRSEFHDASLLLRKALDEETKRLRPDLGKLRPRNEFVARGWKALIDEHLEVQSAVLQCRLLGDPAAAEREFSDWQAPAPRAIEPPGVLNRLGPVSPAGALPPLPPVPGPGDKEGVSSEFNGPPSLAQALRVTRYLRVAVAASRQAAAVYETIDQERVEPEANAILAELRNQRRQIEELRESIARREVRVARLQEDREASPEESDQIRAVAKRLQDLTKELREALAGVPAP